MTHHPSIAFTSIDLDFVLKDQGAISAWLLKIAEQESCFIRRLNYHFCSDEHLLEINKAHLSHDYYTDVITFDESRLPVVKGDVFVSVDRVIENAETLGNSFEPELYRVMVHGLLHLMGFGDKSVSEIDVMRAKEKAALRLLH